MDEEEKKKTPTEYSSCITHRERTEERMADPIFCFGKKKEINTTIRKMARN